MCLFVCLCSAVCVCVCVCVCVHACKCQMLTLCTCSLRLSMAGTWVPDADGQCVTLHRPGQWPSSGNATLCAVTTGGSESGASHSVVAHSDAAALVKSLASGGGGGGVWSSSRSSEGFQGAVRVSTGSVAPGTNVTVVITFGWRFPYRDHFNFNMGSALPAKWAGSPFGNRYADLYVQ
jgi:hypothetical protein